MEILCIIWKLWKNDNLQDPYEIHQIQHLGFVFFWYLLPLAPPQNGELSAMLGGTTMPTAPEESEAADTSDAQPEAVGGL